MIARAAILFAAACLVLAPLPSAAHRGHGVLSVVEIDAKTGGIRVSHRIPTHDVEPALAQIAPDAQTSLDDPEAVVALKAYMLRTFSVRINGALVDLTLQDLTLGATEVRFEYVGQAPPADTRAPIEVRAAMLADVHPDEVNQVNIRRLGVTRTLVFNGADAGDPQTLAPVAP